jgi:hypothetical protein
MSVETKRREILQMLANGTITAAEAGELLTQIDEQINETNQLSPAPAPAAAQEPEPESEPISTAPDTQDRKPRWFHISVTDGDDAKVLVKLPFKLAEWGIRLGAKLMPWSEMDWDGLLDKVNQLKDETLIEVLDTYDSGHVHIYVS